MSEKEEKRDKDNDKHITLKISVNGTPTDVTINENAPLMAAVEKALKQTGNTGRPITDWQIKWNDQTLDIDKKVKEYDFPEGAVLFLSLIAGQGG